MIKRLTRFLLNSIFITAALIFLGLLAWAYQSRTMADLQPWHTEVLVHDLTDKELTSEFTFEKYKEKEELLFKELEEKVYQKGEENTLIFSRYRLDGPQDPRIHKRNWNRSFELVPSEIVGGAVLFHGLTDSPYSLRKVGEILKKQGYYVLGLRLPAHGTTPEALTRVKWKDWVAASRMAVRHVRKKIEEELPLLMAGYSNGGAVSVKYTLETLFDPSLSRPDHILLFSPEIGVSKAAKIANWHKIFSFLPYFEKFKWLSIQPEYDPFKYNSFPKNAGQQANDITVALQNQLDEAREAGKISLLPPITTFTSRKDSTVNVADTVTELYRKLENEESELVVFDVDRTDNLTDFMPKGHGEPLKKFMERKDLPFQLTVISNTNPQSKFVSVKTKRANTDSFTERELNLAWPPQVFSLSHVSINFDPDDPVYGNGENTETTYQGLALGALSPRGEGGLLNVPLQQLMRMHYNPFFPYVEERLIAIANSHRDKAQ